MNKLDRKGLLGGFAAMFFTCLMIFAGSQRLKHFDVALAPYAFGIIFAAFAVTYRYVVWIQRPPTLRYWVQGWSLFLRSPFANLVYLARPSVDAFVTQRFIGRRSPVRGIMHLCLSWGVMIAFAITFPLVFGWMHFETPSEQPVYRLFVLGYPASDFAVDSIFGFLLFNGLNLSGLLVLTGIVLAVQLRLKEPGKLALQKFGNDVAPLLILFLVAATGLGLTVSARWLGGHGYAFLALTHAATVIGFLLYLPFGKFFHIFQRAAQLGVAFYKRAGKAGAQAVCARCHEPFASAMQVEDLKRVEQELGIDYRMTGAVDHYQQICPACRRRLLAFNQGRLLGR
jgi:cytochrome c553